MDKHPPVATDEVKTALREIEEFLEQGALEALSTAAADGELWPRARSAPRDYLLSRDVELPGRLEIVIGPFGPSRWPGRRCFTICRGVDPWPPPPEGPSGITVCVNICIPMQEPGPPPGPLPRT
jgi:hypothetical protein